ncbi:preprotein translocase subunit SecG [Candidatus Peribacteria bacterium RIFCSPLOWO2_12_FULL_55_15]|nr:MAG: preprotein translocase subunit SecG [Candidatus Peribacteria bacterium RIFCSPHIGHO2_01_FULL_54_22]OGJ62557.1 MAG: preprotein translocase subunit SecG [Candidatus Peribacteria bacterium RIFCSPHIGHO2_02_FULL_55_24]OGJ63714.1 MAG: preprotein translocase subunit SecG [Candidatus Peribacteria bacterium RIFCSPHIGHO2_12_FULL_54_10]OGJ68502.1 MAG: preprotein translocase subunit SecG [Candidatus Peribacteria bacterium RIFCSPLOWO2_01_FULL_54_110]OGJ69676.1 MAG: preprotein translocase subunit SecG
MDFFVFLHAAVSILLIISILIQQRTTGFSSAFSGGEAFVVQRRGAERFLFQATVGFSVLFFGLAILQWYL